MKVIFVLGKGEGSTSNSPVPEFVADLVRKLVPDMGVEEIVIKREVKT